jgi:hypothetical protein
MNTLLQTFLNKQLMRIKLYIQKKKLKKKLNIKCFVFDTLAINGLTGLILEFIRLKAHL